MKARRKVWLAPLLRWRDRLLTSADFQRRALRWPIAGWVARRRMRALFDLCSGFVYSQVLLACIRLQLLDRLARSPCSAADLAAELNLPPPSTERLLEAAESLELVESRAGGKVGLGTLGAALLGNPSVAMMIEHHSALYSDLQDPIALLRGQRETTELGRFWAYAETDTPTALGSDETAAYSRLMAASQELIAEQVLNACALQRHRRGLDIGGGEGAFAAAVMKRHAGLAMCVFDLPSVCQRAQARFEQDGFGARAQTHGGDFLNDVMPTGFDLVSLVRVLHDQDDDEACQLLRSARTALTPDGRLLIAEPMLDTRGAERVGAAYFGFYLMAMGQGRARSRREIERMLAETGFCDVKEHRTAAPLLVRVLTARPTPLEGQS